MEKSKLSDNRYDAIHRRKRTKPVSTGKRVTPQSRDFLWFEKIHEHGPLSSSYLHGFSKHLRRSEKRAKERLTDLFNETNTPHGGPYLARPPQQFRTIDSRYNELVYELTPASVAALKENGLWKERMGKHAGPWVHRYMVASITASMELACMDRDDLAYIPQSKILERAGTELRYPTKIRDPETGQLVTRDLIPDALFGLEYKEDSKSFYRFFVVEADRGTEPATSRNFNRKSHLRNLLQYQDYIGKGRYKEHLKLTSPLLVLTVSSDQPKLNKMIGLTGELSGSMGNAYMLYQLCEAFGPVFKPLPPSTQLLVSKWDRVGIPTFCIGKVK